MLLDPLLPPPLSLSFLSLSLSFIPLPPCSLSLSLSYNLFLLLSLSFSLTMSLTIYFSYYLSLSPSYYLSLTISISLSPHLLPHLTHKYILTDLPPPLPRLSPSKSVFFSLDSLIQPPPPPANHTLSPCLLLFQTYLPSFYKQYLYDFVLPSMPEPASHAISQCREKLVIPCTTKIDQGNNREQKLIEQDLPENVR